MSEDHNTWHCLTTFVSVHGALSFLLTGFTNAPCISTVIARISTVVGGISTVVGEIPTTVSGGIPTVVGGWRNSQRMRRNSLRMRRNSLRMRRNSHRMRRNSHRMWRNFRPSGVSVPSAPRCISAVFLAIPEGYFCFLRFFPRFSIHLWPYCSLAGRQYPPPCAPADRLFKKRCWRVLAKSWHGVGGFTTNSPMAEIPLFSCRVARVGFCFFFVRRRFFFARMGEKKCGRFF